jgi:hypothetical protein
MYRSRSASTAAENGCHQPGSLASWAHSSTPRPKLGQRLVDLQQVPDVTNTRGDVAGLQSTQLRRGDLQHCCATACRCSPRSHSKLLQRRSQSAQSAAREATFPKSMLGSTPAPTIRATLSSHACGWRTVDPRVDRSAGIRTCEDPPSFGRENARIRRSQRPLALHIPTSGPTLFSV